MMITMMMILMKHVDHKMMTLIAVGNNRYSYVVVAGNFKDKKGNCIVHTKKKTKKLSIYRLLAKHFITHFDK